MSNLFCEAVGTIYLMRLEKLDMLFAICTGLLGIGMNMLIHSNVQQMYFSRIRITTALLKSTSDLRCLNQPDGILDLYFAELMENHPHLFQMQIVTEV